MEVWILSSSKELKKRKGEGLNERSIDRVYEETRCFFAELVNMKYHAVTKEGEDSQKGEAG